MTARHTTSLQTSLPYLTAILLTIYALAARAAPIVIKDITYGEAPRQKLDIYKPVRTKKDPLLPVHVFVHGGAWKMGNKNQHSGMGDFYAARGVILVAVNYRLFPKDPHPAQVEDVAAALRWVHDHIAEHGGDRNRLVLSGHSAGAHLVALVATDEGYLLRHKLHTDMLAAVVPVDTASFDFTKRETGGPVVRAVNRIIHENFGPEEAQLKAASPVYQAPSNSRLPPFYLFVTDERPDAVKQTRDFAEVLNKAGAPASELNIIDGLSHRAMAQSMSQAGSPIAQRLLRLLEQRQ